MLTQDRYKLILTMLKEKKSITVNELVKKLNTSESTIRRDLNALDNMNKLKKVHGGAVTIEIDYSTEEFDVLAKQEINIDKKRKISRYASTLINSNDFIYIDAGTTTELLVDYLKDIKATYVTNSMIIAKKLALLELNVIILGGKFKMSTDAIVGAEAVNMIRKFNFTKGFFGTNAISIESGYSTPDIEEAAVKEEALNRCKKAYILADEDKFNKSSSVTFGDISKATIITNKSFGEYSIYTEVIEVNDSDLYSNI